MTIALAILAAYRLTRAMVMENGPFHVFLWLRGHLDPDQKTSLGEGYNCPFCLSVWVSLAAAIGITLLGYADPWAWPLTWLGIAGGCTLLFVWELKKR